MDIDGMSALFQNMRADYFYSDPPWGEGNLKYWQTMNHKMTGAQVMPVNLEAFLSQIFKLAKQHCKGLVWIEYGVRWDTKIREYGEKSNLELLGVANIRYSSQNLPLHLYIFRAPGCNVELPKGYLESLEGLKGYPTLQAAIKPFAKPGQTIIDPCCGMGYTAKLAVETGMTFYGNELNAARLEKTIQKLLK